MTRSTAWIPLLACPLAAFAQPQLEGFWDIDRSLPSEGQEYSVPAFTEEGQRRADAYNPFTDDPSVRCVPSGLGRAWDEPDTGFEIQQLDDRVVIRYEMFDLTRTIELNQNGHPIDAAPSTAKLHGRSIPTMGHSIAWYEGDVLVIEMLDYNPGFVSTLVEISGQIIPQSEAMRTQERISRDGERIAVEITYVDRIILEAPLTVQSPFDFTEYGRIEESAEG